MKKVLFFAIVLLSVGMSAQQAKYVWDTPTGEGRQQYVYFRNVVELSDLPSKAELNLYAYTRYALIINGEYINYGPSRSVKKYPYYDTYNILPNLKTGINVITVEASNNGVNTYQLPYGTAAFIAWGDITGNGKNIDLSTPGNWLCRAAKGYAPVVQRFSFATGPLECFDSRLEPDDWRDVDVVEKEWKKPVILNDQSIYGKLIPRIIPPLTQETVTPKQCMFMSNKEFFGDFYNFQVLGDDTEHGNDKGLSSVQAYTYIYSPEKLTTYARLSWGEYWLNGEMLEKIETNTTPFQHLVKMELKEGWNLLFGDMEIVFGGTEFMMVLPDNKNLIVSADKGKDSKKGIAISGPNTQKTVSESQIADFNPEQLDKKAKNNWYFVPSQSPTTNAAKMISWMQERRMMTLDPTRQSGISLSSNDYNNVLFDMGSKLLGRVFVEVDAPAGAVINVTFSENLKDDNIELFRMLTVNSGVRFIAKGGKQRFESYQPYGLRYLQVTVTDDKSSVLLEKVGVISQIYPFDKKGYFTCSDPMLNSIWELGWRTLRVCSEDTYVDTPFRERGHYAGDMYPEYAITLVTGGDSRLVKHTAGLFMHREENGYLGETSHGGDFSAITLLVAAWYIRITNDVDFLKEMYPYFKNYLHRWYENRVMPKGYYQPKGSFIEWLAYDRSAALTAFQTLIYAVNNDMIYLAEQMGDKEESEFAAKRAKETKEMINEHFWGGEGNGVYFDGIDKNGRLITKTNFPNSSLFPMVYGITNPQQDTLIFNTLYYELLKNIMGAKKDEVQKVTSYGSFYKLGAMYAKENAALAEQFIRKHWSPMIYIGDDTAWEDFDYNNGGWTLSHAWSGSPTYFLSTQTLGVQLGFPGVFDPEVIVIAPQSESLSWAKGKVPHPKGLVSVSWRIAGNNLYLDYTAPEGVPVKVQPKGRLAKYNLILNQTGK